MQKCKEDRRVLGGPRARPREPGEDAPLGPENNPETPNTPQGKLCHSWVPFNIFKGT